MMAERGIVVSHTTIMRWVLRYIPEFEEGWALDTRGPSIPPGAWMRLPFLYAVGGTTYRAVDRHGKSVDALGAGIAVWRLRRVYASNVDDHLRNHGLLWTGSKGWSLSPTYDLNPTAQLMHQ
jgi:HipA-like C-terminal domain